MDGKWVQRNNGTAKWNNNGMKMDEKRIEN